MEYITEKRGGWDEWSDEYTTILGLRIPDGTEFRTNRIKAFTDTEGNDLNVDLPQRDEIGSTLFIERLDPYEQWEMSLDEFADRVDLEERTVSL